MFDANDFFNSSNENVLDDKFVLIPEAEYTAEIGMEDDDLKIQPGESTDKDGNPKPWARFIARLKILDPSGELEKAIFRKPMITYDFFLDLDKNGRPDYSKQKNIKLGALLSAVNMNRPGWKPNDLRGKPFKIKVAHVKGMGGNKKAEVVMVGVA